MLSTLFARTEGWRRGLGYLVRRFGQERITQTAASLTFTTVISLVPLMAVMLAVFTAFPAFDELRTRLQEWLAQALLPPNIAASVFDYVNGFAAKAAGLGAAGVIGLLVTATMLLLTVDRSLNLIWRTHRPRPLVQRVLLIWAWLTAGPLLLAFALAQLSLAAALSAGWLSAVPGGTALVGTVLAWLLMGGVFGIIYWAIPNTEVLWRDALTGGVAAAVAFNLASRAFAWYIARLPTYDAVYGTFATLPLTLLWIYWSWLVVLGGALLAAALPALRTGVTGWERPAGDDFVQAIRMLRELAASRHGLPAGLGQETLARALGIEPRRLERLLLVLEALGWIGRVTPVGRAGRARWALLIDPEAVTLAPLIDCLLLDHATGVALGLPFEALRPEFVEQPLARLVVRTR